MQDCRCNCVWENNKCNFIEDLGFTIDPDFESNLPDDVYLQTGDSCESNTIGHGVECNVSCIEGKTLSSNSTKPFCYNKVFNTGNLSCEDIPIEVIIEPIGSCQTNPTNVCSGFTEQSQCELHQEDNCVYQENVCVTVNENCLNSTTQESCNNISECYWII